jgi:phosphatidylserine/phosphatidylglycerophosphate/cardiolipin synthase-like enzyme
LLIDGNEFFPEMLQAIQDAGEIILLEMYLFESGAVANLFIGKLIEASGRGVEVYVLLDDFGARGLLTIDRQRLAAAGARLRFYNPLSLGKWYANMARDHRKLLLIDDRMAFVGGAGITDEFDPPLNRDKRWRETMLRISGPVVADWQSLFAEVWSRQGYTPVELSPISPDRVAAGNMLGRISVARGWHIRGISRSFIRHVSWARKRVWISTAYFIPSRKVRRAMLKAARRGVDVRLLLPGPDTDHPKIRIAGRRYYGSLLKAGVRIYEFQSRVLHSKVVLCDQWVAVGSSNYDRWNLRWNLEANQEIDNSLFAEDTAIMFENDFMHSREIVHEEWQSRPVRQRISEAFWGLVEYWVIRVGGGSRD